MCRQAILSTLLSACAFGQGGPPFLTDDPGTPGNKNWEINIGLIGNRNPSEGAHSVPEFDINYGLGDRARLTHRVPLTVHESRAPEESVAGGEFAVGDLSIAFTNIRIALSGATLSLLSPFRCIRSSF